MLLAARLSERLGISNANERTRLQSLLQTLGLATGMPRDADANALLALMQLDKKNTAGHLRLILWRGIGHAQIVDDVDAAQILATLHDANA